MSLAEKIFAHYLPVRHTDGRGWVWDFGTDDLGRELVLMKNDQGTFINLGFICNGLAQEQLDALGPGTIQEVLPPPDVMEDVSGKHQPPQPMWNWRTIVEFVAAATGKQSDV